MKKALSLVLALAMLLALCACGAGSTTTATATPAAGTEAPTGTTETANNVTSKELNIFMWGDYISDELISNFEKQYNCTVNLSYMSDNADSITKLTAGAGNEYDLVMTCDAYMQSLIAGGYLEQLDLSKIPNSKNINTNYWSEENQQYCVPYLMNYIYVVYNTKTCPKEITCYNDLIDPAMKGQIGSVDGARNLFPIALIALGYDPNSTDPDQLKQAYDWLVKYNANVVAYGSTEQNMVNGTISCMLTYDGNASWAMSQMGANNTLKIADFKSDPVQLGFDLYVVPKGAQHEDLSYAFLNYICDPQVMAKNLVEYPYSCPNDAAVALAPDSYKNDPAFNFGYKTNIFFQKDVGDALSIYDQYYQMLKIGG